MTPPHTQLLVWTALPNGPVPGHAGKVQISVALSPRLMSTSAADQPLGDYRDWLDWPAHRVSFTVNIGGHVIPANHVTVVPPPVPLPTGVTSSHLWRLLFKTSTVVQPYEFSSYAGKFFNSYPANHVRGFLLSTYTQIAAQYPTNFPPYEALVPPDGVPNQWFGELPINSRELEDEAESLRAALHGTKGAFPPGKANPTTDLVQAWFYNQPPYTLKKGEVPPPPKPAKPDFHQMVSTLGKYPVLLRAFGLVYDLQVTLPSGLPATVGVSVQPTWTPLLTPATATSDALPAVQTTTSTFRPTPRSSDPFIRDGLLRLDNKLASGEPEFPLTEVDLDGSAIKSLNFVQGIVNAVNLRPTLGTDAQTQYSVPSLRSSGVTLVHTGTAADFAADQGNQAAINSDLEALVPVTLYAEDIAQGYRVDVLDETTRKWYQLCARVAAGTVYGGSAPKGYVIGSGAHAVTQRLPGGTAGTAGPGPGETGAPFDEGWVELSLTQSPSWVSPVSDYYLHEKLCRWAGWSLIADRPGKHWAESTNTPAPNPYNAKNPTQFPLQVAHAAAPGTLPLLRFGRTYRFRARAVDSAGNSLVFRAAAPPASLTHASPPITYGRFEPIQTPVCIPLAPKTPGEHLLNIVIRSENYSTPPKDVTPNARHVVPPSLAAEMAEAHGLFDVAGKPSGSTATYDLIKNSVGLTYASKSVRKRLGGVFDSSWVNKLWPERLFYYATANLACPYLPEVFARGAAFQDLPGMAANSTPLRVAFADGSSPWPAVRPLRVELKPGSGPPTLVSSSSGNVLNVHAPPGTITTSRLSAYLHAGDLDSMGIWLWLGSAGLVTPALRTEIITGRHWMFTPFQEVTFVHAVRTPKPLAFTHPKIEKRRPGATYALFSDTIKVDFGGSNKLDLLSSWHIPFDDGVNPDGAVILKGSSHLADLPLLFADPVPQSIAVDNVRHDFGDTKYRLVDYEAQATSRYLEYFQEFVSVTLSTTKSTTINAGGLATGATVVTQTFTTSVGTPPKPKTSTITLQPEVDYHEDDTKGTLKLTAAGAAKLQPPGTVDVRYVAPPVTNVSPVAPLAVVSTARPATPDIAYVLPLFGFSTRSTSSKISSIRAGNALRVYLNRPWYSSGADEQLGVVVYTGAAAPSTAVAPLVSGYGRDPIRTTNLQTRQPALSDFTLAKSTATGISLEETAATLVSIAGHEVHWEGTNHFLWYADIEIDSASLPGYFSYFPFIQLALVRFQPHSLHGYEISRVALADFVQVAPNRFATLTFPTTTTVSVFVTGVGEAAGSQIGVPPSSMTATLQTKVSHVTDPDLQWVDVTGSSVTLEATESHNYSFAWSGVMTLPVTRGSKPMRIRIAEAENYLYEPPNGGRPTYSSRLVYLDTLVI
jgi:hypothetical protein